jgi:hypothetical protein
VADFWWKWGFIIAVLVVWMLAAKRYGRKSTGRSSPSTPSGFSDLDPHLTLDQKRWVHGHLDFALGADDWWSHTCSDCTPVSKGKGRVLAHEMVAMPAAPTHDCYSSDCDFVTEGDMFGNKVELVTFHRPKQRILPATKNRPPGRYEEADGSITFYYPEPERLAVTQEWGVR